MPNWCNNKVFLKAPSKELVKKLENFESQNSLKDSGTYFSLSSIIEPPSEADQPDFDWYKWSLQNWGTKWDVESPKPEIFFKDIYVYTFMSAWTGPEPVVQRISKDYGIKTAILQEEPSNGFTAFTTFNQGNATVIYDGDHAGVLLEPAGFEIEKSYSLWDFWGQNKEKLLFYVNKKLVFNTDFEFSLVDIDFNYRKQLLFENLHYYYCVNNSLDYVDRKLLTSTGGFTQNEKLRLKHAYVISGQDHTEKDHPTEFSSGFTNIVEDFYTRGTQVPNSTLFDLLA